MPAVIESSTAERLLDVATCFFAQKGYHGASMREMAHQAGVSVATLYYYAQSKDDLYRQVFERQYRQENQLIREILPTDDEAIIRHPEALRGLFFRLMDALIDRSIQNPDIVRLWTRRWLEQPANNDDIEAQYSIPIYQSVEHLLERARAAGTIQPDLDNLSLLTRGFTWLHYGFFSYGNLTYDIAGRLMEDPGRIKAFRLFVREFVCRMLRFRDQIQSNW